MTETNGGLSSESESGQHGMKDGAEAEPLVEAEAKEACNDIEMLPHVSTEATNDGANASEFEGVLDKTEMKCSADGVTNNIEEQPQLERHVEDVVDATELKSCSEIQLKEAVDHAELKPCSGPCAKEVLSGAVLEPFSGNLKNEVSGENCSESLAKDAEVEPNEVLNDIGIEPCGVNHATMLFDNGNFDQFSYSNEAKEVKNDIDLVTCHKDQVKEPTNDDMHSEVSNPNLSPKHVTSSLTISSQPIDVLGSERGGCGEITSVCSWDSVVDGRFCEEERSNCKLGSVSTACVVLEIPKHVRPTGIRKITFKFSKRKQDYDTGILVSAKPLADNKFHEGFHDNQLSVRADESLANNDFPTPEWNALETAKVNSSMDGGECHDTRSPSSSYVPNMELKMSKKIILDNYPTNVKKLLSTGILEGARVKYITLSGEKELPGIINGCGYLCGCCNCSFSKVLNAYDFEVHAGSKTRHPNNHIYLENGKSLHSIVDDLRSASLSTIDDVIRAVAGSSVNEEYFQAWKAQLQNNHAVACTDNEYQSKHLGMYHFPTSDDSHYTGDSSYPNLYWYPHMTSFDPQGYIEVPVEQKRPTKKPRHNFSSSCWEHKKTGEGGTKKRDNDLHKLLFLPNGLPDGTNLAYYSKGKKILGGYKQGNGIVCSCCNCEISPSQFEAHAGWAAKRQPYRNIYTSSGLTLHDIALMLANGQRLSGSDDMCAVCGDGGELITCNGCPRVFHAGCLGLHCLPANDWHCPHCKDKFGPGRKATVESKPIIIRLKRVVKAPEFEPGGCVICRSQDFSAAKFDDRTVIICDQCEKEYHVGCLRESELCDLKELPEDKWFCCNECNKIFEALQNLACSGPEVIPAAASAAVYKKQATIGLNDKPMDEIRWCILSGKSRFPDHLLLLSRAAAIFRERFDPIVAKSGRDIIPVMVYGRNISGQEFSGMHCVVLLVKSVVVSAALLRIFGRDVAELPLVATNRENQGKGYFQALFTCIESFLSSLSVKHLVLPAAVEAEPMWTNKLGFRKTTNEQMLKYTRDFQLTIFKGTYLLEKDVQQ
ncbi:hypothetical protein ACS0TY_015997 [Phlomoides rotata]